jgi:hypothetical protein
VKKDHVLLWKRTDENVTLEELMTAKDRYTDSPDPHARIDSKITELESLRPLGISAVFHTKKSEVSSPETSSPMNGPINARRLLSINYCKHFK